MSQSVLKLKVDGREFDANIKSAEKGLQAMEQSLKHAGKSFKDASKESIEYVRALGKMETKSNTAKGKVGELSKAYTELRAQYNRLTAEEKRGDFGKALNKSLEQLRARTIEAKGELNGISKELSGNMSGALSDIAGKFGINSDLMGVLTTGTMAYTAAITAAAAAVAEAAKAWAEYNSELGKQDQITSVTTGLKGNDAKAMTDQVRAIAQTYNVDFREAINAANTLMTQFGLDGQKSLNLLKKGMQGMIQGDGGKMLSMIQQYAPAFRDAGIEADQLVAIIHNTEGGIFTDQNMNAIVMGIKNIRLMKDTTKEAMQQIGIDADTMAKKLNDGTMSVFEALRIVADAIDETGSGSEAAGKIMQDVFGRQGTMAGTKLGEAIANLNLNLDETSRQTGNVGTAMSELEEATERLNTQMRNTFGYDGWEEMEMGLRSKLYNAITNIMVAIEGVERAIGGVMSAFATLSEYIGTSTIISIFEGIRTSIVNSIGPLAQAVNLAWDLVNALSAVPDVNVPTVGGGIGEGLGAVSDWGHNMLKKISSGNSGGNGGGGGGGGSHTPKVRIPKTSHASSGGHTTTTKEVKELIGTVPILEDKLKKLKEAQLLVTSSDDWMEYDRQIADVTKKIDEFKNGVQGTPALSDIKLEGMQGLSLPQLQRVNTYSDNRSGLKKMIGSNGYQGAKAASEGLGQLSSGLKGMGIELGEGFDKTVSFLQSIFTVIEAVQTIFSALQMFTTTNDGLQTGILTEIAANTLATAAATATDALTPLHTGGLVHAANGVFVPGASNGGRDTVRALLSPGELVLNAAQQSNLATQLQAGAAQRNENIGWEVQGEKIHTVLYNYQKRSGKRLLA